nr:RNA-directed DNA polymerase, eukaryota [Tanacetum cinerariifolium]
MEFKFSRGLSTAQSAELEVMFSKVEIKEGVWSCGSYKSPSLDGFTFSFFKDIGVVNPVFSKDYRPISLIGSFYKTVCKLLTNRITSGVEDLISIEQSAFVKGRQIMDGLMIVNKILNWCKKEKKKTLIFKVDFKKAYGGGGSHRHEMANIIGCEASAIPWKVKTLSVGGQLTLLKSVLGSIVIYYMIIFKTPIAVIKEIEAIRNQIFLGADTDENKMTWIKWNKVMASKKDGGLGDGSLYGMFILDDFLKREVGDGLETRFWDDYWISDGLLKDLYRRVYNLDQNPESVVANRLNLVPNAPFLRRNLRGGAEKDQWVALLSLLETHVSFNQRDRWIWTGDGDGIYSVNCGWKLIDKGTLCLDTYATRWLKEMPTKVNIFIWRMLLNKIPTRMNLMTRGITVKSNQCGICDEGDETINHLMLHCDLARDLWALVGLWWTLDLPFVLTIRELMSWVDHTRLHILANKVLHVVVGTTAWSICNFRKRNVFQEEKPKKALLFYSIVSTSFFWLSNRNNNFRINWIGFLQDPIIACNSL